MCGIFAYLKTQNSITKNSNIFDIDFYQYYLDEIEKQTQSPYYVPYKENIINQDLFLDTSKDLIIEKVANYIKERGPDNLAFVIISLDNKKELNFTVTNCKTDDIEGFIKKVRENFQSPLQTNEQCRLLIQSSVLHLRGEQVTPQPLISSIGEENPLKFVLAFNGEIFKINKQKIDEILHGKDNEDDFKKIKYHT